MPMGSALRPRIDRWTTYGQQIGRAALRRFVRLLPAERQRVFALTLLLGGLCGLAAVAFHLAIQAAEVRLIDRALAATGRTWIVWTILLPALGGLVSGIILVYVVPDARGSGIPQVKVAYAINGGRLPFRVVIGKFCLGVIQIGAGSSLGREGPTVQICAGIASLVGRGAALSRQSLRNILPVGAAAGIAAAFNAPIAAVTFTLEEVIGDLNHAVLAGIIVAAALAAAIEHAILGAHPVFAIPAGYGLHYSSSLLLYAVLGVAAAVVGILFCDGLLGLRRYFQRLTRVPVWARPAIGGLITGGLAVAALLWLHTGGITGAGYATLAAALAGRVPLTILLALCLLKALATMLSYSSGGAGGLFAPALFIGGMLGGAVGFADVQIFHHSTMEIGAFALVGMGAVFAAIIRAPITSILIIMEMTGGYELILPLMIANMTAYSLARLVRPLPIYEALLVQDGVHLPHSGQPAPHVLELLRVGDALRGAAVTLPDTLSAEAALRRTEETAAATFPVLDQTAHLVGCVTTARLRRTIAEGHGEQPLAVIADERPLLTADQPVLTALALMDQTDTSELPVVDQRAAPRLIGMLTMGDIVHAQATALDQSGLAQSLDGRPMSEVAEILRLPRFTPLPSLSAHPLDASDTAADETLHYHLVTVPAESCLVGESLEHLHLPAGVLIVMIERGPQALIPHGSTRLAAGDRITLVAGRRHIHQLHTLFSQPAPATPSTG